MKNKKYYYLVSFLHKQGNGCGLMTLDFKIKTFSDLNKLQDLIVEKNNIKSVCVTNFIRMKGE